MSDSRVIEATKPLREFIDAVQKHWDWNGQGKYKDGKPFPVEHCAFYDSIKIKLGDIKNLVEAVEAIISTPEQLYVYKLYEKAISELKNGGKPSPSFLQRKLCIGFHRAEQIIDMLEDAGIISAPSHTGMRTIISLDPKQESDREKLVAALNQMEGNKLVNILPEPASITIEPNIFCLASSEDQVFYEEETLDIMLIGFRFFEVLEFRQGIILPNNIFVVPTGCGNYEKFDTLEAAQAFVDQQKESEGA